MMEILLLIAVCAFWILDAALITLFLRVLPKYYPRDTGRLIMWKRICVSNNVIGLSLYAARLVIEAIDYNNSGILYSFTLSLVILAFIFGLKVMRLLAVNSFSHWLRLQSPWSVAPPGVPLTPASPTASGETPAFGT
mmetsp:Transcript_117484/g.184764  ORF Transcript_117484/g.184764 Transcript_117484/m.184764 type:complete len:137 (+) Transcript_117484:3-413(+)